MPEELNHILSHGRFPIVPVCNTIGVKAIGPVRTMKRFAFSLATRVRHLRVTAD